MQQLHGWFFAGKLENSQRVEKKTGGGGHCLAHKIKVWLAGSLWVCGMLLAGSDGAWMPYVNYAGGLTFFAATACLVRLLPGMGKSSGACRATPVKTGSMMPRQGHRISSGFVRNTSII